MTTTVRTSAQPPRTDSKARDDRRCLQASQRRVSRHLDLEDQVPRGPGPALPAPHAGRLPAVQRGRHRAARVHPPAPAGRVPPLARHPRGACDAALPDAAGDGRDPISGSAPRRSISSSSASAPASRASSPETSRSTGSSLRRSAAASATTRSWTWRRRSRAAASRRRACPRGISGRSARLPIARPGLLGQVAAPALSSRNPERHQQGLEDLRSLGEAAEELTQLLLWRALRRIAAG